MRTHLPKVCLALILASACCAAWSGVEMLLDPMPSRFFANRDDADIGRACFESLKPALKNVRFAGYAASRPPSTMDDMADIFLAQYFLAPTVLRAGLIDPYVVAKLDNRAELDALVSRGNFEVISRSAHPGVALLKKRGSP
jgi:hypothetical protein